MKQILFLLFLVGSIFAGTLFTETRYLSSLINPHSLSHDTVFVGTITKVDTLTRKVTLSLSYKWEWDSTYKKVELSENRQFTIPKEFVWEDENISPIVEKWYNELNISTLKQGQRVLFIWNSPIFCDDFVEKKLETIFTNKTESFITSCSQKELTKLLQDGDFQKRALEELRKRDVVDIHLLACNYDQYTSWFLLGELQQTMKVKIDSIPELAKALEKSKNPTLIYYMLSFIDSELYFNSNKFPQQDVENLLNNLPKEKQYNHLIKRIRHKYTK